MDFIYGLNIELNNINTFLMMVRKCKNNDNYYKNN